MATSTKHSGWKKTTGQTYIEALNLGIAGLRLTKSVTGCDVRLLGDTPATYYIDFDASGPTYTLASVNLSMTGTAVADIGTTGTPLVLTAGSPIVDIYSTCASTSGSTNAEPFYLKSTMTGAAGVGGRARFHLYSNVALGGWANALKAYTEFGASGRITGLASAFCGETVLSAGCTQGTYCALEAELVAASGAVTGTSTSFIYCNTSDASGKVNDNAYLFELGAGLTSNSAHLWYDNTSGVGDEFVRVKTPNGAKYIILSDSTDLS